MNTTGLDFLSFLPTIIDLFILPVPFVCLLLTILYALPLTQGATVNVRRSTAPEDLTGRSLLELFPPEEESDLARPRSGSFPEVFAGHQDYQRLGSSSGLSLNSILQASREQLIRTLQNQKQQLIKRWNEMLDKLKAVIIAKIQSFLNFNDNFAAYVTQLLQQISNGSTTVIHHIQEAIRKYLQTLVQNFGLNTTSFDD